MYKLFVAWSCNGCITAYLTDYTNNAVYQELTDEEDYYTERSDERIYLDLRASSGYTKEAEKLERDDSKINLHLLLKSTTTTNLRVRVWTHSMGEYLNILTKNGLTL